MKTLVVFAAIAIGVSSCTGSTTDLAADVTQPEVSPTAETSSTTDHSGTPETAVTSSPPAPAVPKLIEDWDIGYIELGDSEFFVAIAATPQRRRQGLMNIGDLGDLDGMLFVFDDESTGGFWMKDTLIPLDIAFFDADGLFVDGFAMEPCELDDCPTYRPSGAYRFALEMAAGSMPVNPQVLVTGFR
jgi:uncharacterized membrane protein (UPF0127 family)